VKEDGMVDSIKGSREVEEAEAGDMLLADSLGDEVVKGKENCFSGVERDIGRLVGIIEGVIGEVLG
jgi:hypothetical protein